MHSRGRSEQRPTSCSEQEPGPPKAVAMSGTEDVTSMPSLLGNVYLNNPHLVELRTFFHPFTGEVFLDNKARARVTEARVVSLFIFRHC